MLSQKLTSLRKAEPENPLSAHAIRSQYFENYNEQELLESYRHWRQLPLWLLFLNTETKQIISVRGTKRGDKRHARKALSSFDRAHLLKPIIRQQQRTKKSPPRTNCLWITLTYDGKTGPEAYEYIGQDFNRFITALRKIHKKIDYLRVWESQERGTPHIHVLVIFRNKTWSWAWRKDKKNHLKQYPRIFGYKQIKKHWNHGFSDIKAVHDYEGAVCYLKKYLTKQLESRDDKDDLACAHQMIYKNQSYHVPSKPNIAKATQDPDLIMAINNSNPNPSKSQNPIIFIGTFHSYEIFHRSHIFKVDIKEPYISTIHGNHDIKAVYYLYNSEMKYQDGLIQSTLTETNYQGG